MACSCQKKNGVQVKANNERVVYTSSSVASAWAVARRYPGSTVWQDGQQLDPPTTTAAPATTTPVPTTKD